jgi:hypothetical protein
MDQAINTATSGLIVPASSNQQSKIINHQSSIGNPESPPQPPIRPPMDTLCFLLFKNSSPTTDLPAAMPICGFAMKQSSHGSFEAPAI